MVWGGGGGGGGGVGRCFGNGGSGNFRHPGRPVLVFGVRRDIGFEFPVLRGLSGYLQTSRDRPLIVCEIAPAAYPLLKLSITDLIKFMGQFGYQAYSTEIPTEKVNIERFHETTNIFFKTL